MSTVRIARGAATGPTAMAAYDAALAAAGAHEFNLVGVSSVVPPDASLERVETLAGLGHPGDRLHVVQSRVDRPPDADTAGVAGLGWARSAAGPGVIYEAAGDDPETVRETIRRGLAHAGDLRGWDATDGDVVVTTAAPTPDAYACAIVLAAIGHGDAIG